MNRRYDPYASTRDSFEMINHSLILLCMIAVVLMALTLAQPQAPAGDGAVCGTDAECAQWEVEHNIPADQRCYGDPCPAPAEVR